MKIKPQPTLKLEFYTHPWVHLTISNSKDRVSIMICEKINYFITTEFCFTDFKELLQVIQNLTHFTL